MTPSDDHRINCYVLVPSDESYADLKEFLTNVLNEMGVLVSFPDTDEVRPLSDAQVGNSGIRQADIALVEVSEPDPLVSFDLGRIRLTKKPVVFLIKQGLPTGSLDIEGSAYIQYDLGTEEGKRYLSDELYITFQVHRLDANTYKNHRFAPWGHQVDPDAVNLTDLDQRDFENLCVELLIQMGFHRVEWGVHWGVEWRGFDIVATLPKRDPDGYEYHELWLVSVGHRLTIETMLAQVTSNPDHFLNAFIGLPREQVSLFSSLGIRIDEPITLLFILGQEGPSGRLVERALRDIKRKMEAGSHRFNLRIRWWGLEDVRDLVVKYPQLVMKYVFEKGPAGPSYRKTKDELYHENVLLTKKLMASHKRWEEERVKRSAAERDAAWKDVAMKAAHKLANPVGAIETFLQGMKRRINDRRLAQALELAKETEICIENVKKVLDQLKSLAKAEHLDLRPTELSALVRRTCKIAEEKGFQIALEPPSEWPRVMADKFRIAECFEELLANTMKWARAEGGKIWVSAATQGRDNLPLELNGSKGYLHIVYRDNGPGILISQKEEIFAPFVTKDPHSLGLGLAMIRSIIEGHGGSVVVGPSVPGAHFDFYLPLADS